MKPLNKPTPQEHYCQTLNIKNEKKNANKFQFHRSWTCITMDEFNLKQRLSSCSVLTVSSEPVTICLIELYLRIRLYECTG